MTEYLIETYLSGETEDTVVALVDDVARAADQVSRQGIEVRFVRAIYLPEEETCFYLYQSSSADAVREAAARARLPLERTTEAVSITAAARGPIRNPNQ
jgi:hypothetical protein